MRVCSGGLMTCQPEEDGEVRKKSSDLVHRRSSATRWTIGVANN